MATVQQAPSSAVTATPEPSPRSHCTSHGDSNSASEAVGKPAWPDSSTDSRPSDVPKRQGSITSMSSARSAAGTAGKGNVWGNSCCTHFISIGGSLIVLVSTLGDSTLWGTLLSVLCGASLWNGAFLTTYLATKKPKGPKRAFPSRKQVLMNGFFLGAVQNFYYTMLWAVPVLLLRLLTGLLGLTVHVNPVSCLSFGSHSGWFLYTLSSSRAKSDGISCFTMFATRYLRDPPLLLGAYLLDRGVSSLFGSPPCPCFHDGTGALISDINEDICMGGRPLAQHVPELLQHRVHSVVNMTCELPGPRRAYDAAGIVQLHLPTLDFTEPSSEDLVAGVTFIQERLRECGGGRVYVHCKAGRARAGCMVLCALMAMDGSAPETAFKLMKEKRPVVEKILLTYSSVMEFSPQVLPMPC